VLGINARIITDRGMAKKTMTTTRTTITILTREKTVIVPVDGAPIARCEKCNEQVFLSSAESAATVLQVLVPAVFNLIEGGVLHAIQGPSDATMICSNSLCLAASHFTKEAQPKTS